MRTPVGRERRKLAGNRFERGGDLNRAVGKVVDDFRADPFETPLDTFETADGFGAFLHVKTERFAERQRIVDVFDIVFSKHGNFHVEPFGFLNDNARHVRLELREELVKFGEREMVFGDIGDDGVLRVELQERFIAFVGLDNPRAGFP